MAKNQKPTKSQRFTLDLVEDLANINFVAVDSLLERKLSKTEKWAFITGFGLGALGALPGMYLETKK